MNADDRTQPTRQAILEAAEAEFLRFGFRKTSMEGIARAAGVAKATLYAHFSTKQVVFDGVCARRSELLADEAREAGERAADPAKAAVASLYAKFTAIFELVHRSPHAVELLRASRSRDHEQTARAHDEYVAEIAGLLERALKIDRAEALELAEVAERGAEGVLQSASSAEELERHLGILLGRLIGG